MEHLTMYHSFSKLPIYYDTAIISIVSLRVTKQIESIDIFVSTPASCVNTP